MGIFTAVPGRRWEAYLLQAVPDVQERVQPAGLGESAMHALSCELVSVLLELFSRVRGLGTNSGSGVGRSRTPILRGSHDWGQ